MRASSSPDSGPSTSETWSAEELAAVASAEAIAAVAAAEVAAEAAVAAQAAVEVASAVAARAAAKASDVAALAVLAVAAAGDEGLRPGSIPEQSRVEGAVQPAPVDARAAAAAVAADKVALSVVAVAAAAAQAVVDATTLVGAQLAADVRAAAAAVSVAAELVDPRLVRRASRRGRSNSTKPPGEAALAAHAPVVRGAPGIAEELRQGLAANELRLHYQPIIDLGNGQPVGVEALVRWQHPVRGLLAPAEFLDVAERTDLVLPLGAWVLLEACRFAVSLQARGGDLLTVAVNLSGRQLSDPGLVATAQACMEAHGCTADRLVFEVTETALVTDMQAAISSLQSLRALGAGVSIDDFGTGYSSLLYLKYLSANSLKIDRSFVSGLARDSHDTAIVASLVSLAHNLEVQCVAEGVETHEQLELLTQLGCDLAQGYLFCRPLDETALEAWLERNPTSGVQHRNWVARNPQTPRILAMHNNRISVHSIAAALNAEGNRAPSGLRWSAQSVAQILARSSGGG